MPVTSNIYTERLAKAKARAERRKDNARFQAKVAGKPVKSVIGRGPLKKNIVTLLGWLDRKINGPLCRYGALCPAYRHYGSHNGDSACHLVPQQTGDGARFMPENVVWGCHAANFGEVHNRTLYRMIHVQLFGAERIERLETAARTGAKYTKAELLLMREQIKLRLSLP